MSGIEIPEEDNSCLDEISTRFIRAVKMLKGNKDALRVLEAIKTVLGEDWAARIVFNELSDNFSTIEGIAIVGFNRDTGKMINAIKELRTISGLGLKEAKDAIEGASCGHKIIVSILKDVPAKQAEDSIRALRSFGAKVIIT
jgi:ribosomal protein L7/L12